MARQTPLLAAVLVLLATGATATSFTDSPVPGRHRNTRCYRSPTGRATECPGHTVCLLRRMRRSGWANGRCTRLGYVPRCNRILCGIRDRRAACAAGGVYFICGVWTRMRSRRARCRVAPNGLPGSCAGGLACVLQKVRGDGWGRGECRRLGWTPGCGRWWCRARGGAAVCRSGGRYFTCRSFAGVQRLAERGARSRVFLTQFRGGPCFGGPTGLTTHCRNGGVCLLSRARADGWARGQCSIVESKRTRCSRRHCSVRGERSPCVDGGFHWHCRGWRQARRLSWRSLGAPAKAVVPAAGLSPGACTTAPTRGAQQVRCPKGQTCVVTDFGIPAVDRPSVGRCQTLVTPAPVCTLDLCGGRGAATACSPAGSPTVLTCGAWAARADGGARPDCGVACSADCALGTANAPADSNGKRYCNACVLRVASCNAAFSFYGPVGQSTGSAPPAPGAPSLPSAPVGGCSTSPSQVAGAPPPGPACPSGEVCVISNFGLPAADQPNSGRCVAGSKPARCTVDRCGASGADIVCTTPDTGDATTCGAWAKRTDGGVRPNCGRFCTADCALGTPGAPADNNGKRYCNACVLRVASCGAGFALFGPVAAPDPVGPRSIPAVSTPVPVQLAAACSFDLCTARGASAVCALPDSKQQSTCGGWAGRSDGGVLPKCAQFCTADCKLGTSDAPADSTGKRYCNACVLRVASCGAGFAFFGPVAQSVRAPSPAPAAPVLPVATPAPVRLPNTCSFLLCTAAGARTACTTPDTKTATTCGGWSKRTDGGQKPDCGIVCAQDCPGGVKDNTRKDYCNACILRAQSCAQHFTIFGPIFN